MDRDLYPEAECALFCVLWQLSTIFHYIVNTNAKGDDVLKNLSFIFMKKPQDSFFQCSKLQSSIFYMVRFSLNIVQI